MRTLVITGGTANITFLEGLYKDNQYDYCIGVDKGAEYAYRASIKPDLVLGDFDSADSQIIDCYRVNEGIEVRHFPAEKDETDTHLALLEAIEVGSTQIDIVGGIGTRMDHTLANIHIMLLPLEAGISCRIINESNIITLINQEVCLRSGDYPYVSLIPLTTSVKGITTEGMKYSLEQYTMKQGISVGISNEICGTKGRVSVTDGILIIIQSRDL